MRKLSHNKRRNVGLAYEFLTRDIARATLARDSARAAQSLGIISQHLSEGTPLFQELSLHRQAMASRGVGERLARKIVDELRAAGIRNISRRGLLERAKSNLIHEMNRGLGRDIFDRYRIPDYTAHASIAIIMSRGLGRVDEGVEAAKVEEHLISYLMGSPSESTGCDPDATMYAYRTAVSLFEREVGRELLPGQTELLRECVRVSLGGNRAPLERLFDRQRRELSESLRTCRSDEVFSKDPEMLARLDEALADLRALPGPTDEAIERMMLFHNLQKEIQS